MASARITASNENVQTYGNGTRDFTDFNTWEAATDIDLVGAAQSEVLECFDDAASFDDNIDAAGATTNASFFRIIRPASGQGHDGTPNNGFFIDSTIADHTFRITEDFFSLQDIIIRHIFSSSDEFNVTMRGDNSTCIGVICFDSVNNGAGGASHFNVFDGVDVVFVDCIGINPDQHNFRLNPGGGITTYVYNCNAIDAASNGVRAESGTIVAKNVLSTGNGTDFVTAGGVFTGSVTNASGDATAPGSTPRINQTFTFVNAASDDYHLAAGDAGAKDFGTDLSADAVFAFDDDIDGDLFGTWDIGFDEPTVPVAVVSDALVSYAAQIGLLKDAGVEQEAGQGITEDKGPNLESLVGLTVDAGPSVESEVSISEDFIANIESLLTVIKDVGPNMEAGQGIQETLAPNFETLIGILKDAGVNMGAEGRIDQDGISNFETLISILKDETVNYESLVGLVKDAVVNIESLQGFLILGGVNFETVINVLKDAGVNFESLLSVLQDNNPNFEALQGVLNDGGVNIESLGILLSDGGVNFETLRGIFEIKGVNFETLKGVFKDAGVNLGTLGTVTSDRPVNFESLIGVLQSAANINISTFILASVVLALTLALDEQTGQPGDVETLNLTLSLEE